MLTEEAVGTFLHSCEASYVASDLDDPRLGKMAAVRELFQGRYLIFANQKCLYLTYWHLPRLLHNFFGPSPKLNVQIIASGLTLESPIQNCRAFK
jgi:hypothetical protein